jgi:hypothetical protein
MAWNSEHGAMLRVSCSVMMMTKDALANLAGSFERDGKFDEALASYDGSIKFFTDMAKTVQTAKMRLLIGSAVYRLRLDSRSDTGRRHPANAPRRGR